MLQPWNSNFSAFKEDYEYKYQPIQQPKYDPVIRTIYKVLKEIRRDDCMFANAGVRVYSATVAPSIWPHDACHPQHTVKFYTFTQQGLEFPMTVPVTVYPRFGSLEGDMLFVKTWGKWMPIKEWLLTIPHAEVGAGRTTFQMTRTFWQRNGRVFGFMDLPVDARNTIYEHVFGREIYPLPKMDGTWQDEFVRRVTGIVLGAGYTQKLIESYDYKSMRFDDFVHEAYKPVHTPNLAVLRVRKQVCEEALKIGWESALKCFNDDQLFVLVAEAKLGPLLKFNCLNKIQLNFTLKGWFRFFGVEVNPTISILETDSNAALLTKAKSPKLRRLEMRFRSPEDGYIGNHWLRFNAHDHFDCCQIDAVDMVCISRSHTSRGSPR
ncbi:hypothetical protein CC86DRAFT_164001 [Ophiobolus disseminans]|uniref:Uncharacterized protein n=1 Tax=Ophiobolus disseminans TaxID=1469910 RepID=A0A6A7ABC8_9PLEO|nr:hypothetical protein CC86DRAFT_164001 [Ophiobolus disseminans]